MIPTCMSRLYACSSGPVRADGGVRPFMIFVFLLLSPPVLNIGYIN